MWWKWHRYFAMNFPYDTNPLLDPTKNFWDRHPYLKGFGTKFLPSLAAIESASIAFLNHIGYRVSANVLLSICGIPIAAFLALTNTIYILDQRKIIKALREEIDIQKMGNELLKKKLSSKKKKSFDKLMEKFRSAKSNPTKLFEIVIYFLWANEWSGDEE